MRSLELDDRVGDAAQLSRLSQQRGGAGLLTRIYATTPAAAQKNITDCGIDLRELNHRY